MHLWSLALALVTLVTLRPIAAQTVNTTSGRFTGRQASGTTGVIEYLGIPYAQAPTGNLRFAPPVRARYFPITRNASRVTPCPANPVLGPGGIEGLTFSSLVNFGVNGVLLYDTLTNKGFTYAEDCLQLNVWTKPSSGESSKAVMFFIHGGAYAFGSSADPRYNGKYLADKHDVVVVTINYRLNIFGFPGAPNTRQNLAFLDQRLAVEWVRDNIALFGGDPKRITLFGQSAGAAAQEYYSLVWQSDPIVNAFIIQSGTVIGLQPAANRSAVLPWYEAAARAGCIRIFGGDEAILQCMRSRSFQQILNAISGISGYGSILAAIRFGPEIDNSIAFIDSTARFESGRFIKKPTLIGSNEDEADIIIPAGTALNSFPPPRTPLDVGTQLAFSCPAGRSAKIRAQNGVKTYRYRWFGYFPNTALGLGKDASKAYHESELSTIFGTSSTFGGDPNTPDQQVIQEYMMRAWTTFAKDPMNGLERLGWPAYTTSNPQVVRLAYQNKPGISVVPASTYDAACPPELPTDVLQLLLNLIKPV